MADRSSDVKKRLLFAGKLAGEITNGRLIPSALRKKAW
jgi:hypothetical protein